MADNAAGKLAAGRKMLKEFQSKKKTDPQPVGSTKTSTSSNINDLNKPLNSVINNQLDLKTNNDDKDNITTEYFGDITPPQRPSAINYATAGLQDNSTASLFFDKITPDSAFTGNQNSSSDDGHVENGLPLAGILFSGQNQLLNSHEENANPAGSIPYEDIHKYERPLKNVHDTNVVASEVKETFSDDYIVSASDIKTQVEISKLQQQLQFHIKTVEFLVSEKNELLEKVNGYEKVISSEKAQSEDLSGRLNISRHRASHLEMECNSLKQKNQESESRIAQLLQENNNLKTSDNFLKSHQKDVEEELQELKTLLNDKIIENKNFSKQIEEMSFQLNSNQLRFQQMLRLQENKKEIEDTPLAEKYHKQQMLVENLQQQLSELEVEKNQCSFQFQDYVQQLNQQIETLNGQENQLAEENEQLKERERQLINQMCALEKQMQLLHKQNYIEEEIQTRKNIETSTLENLQTENDKLHADIKSTESALHMKMEEVNHYQRQLEELSQTMQQIQSESPDSTKLNAAMESDRLAAQMATSQNAKMKLDLQHLEKAFEQMTHSKLELAELLQAEKNLSKTLTLKLVETEDFLKETRSRLHAKDEEMIRLQAVSSNLEKEILKQAQITDRLNHYEAQGQSSEILQSELQTTQNIVKFLTDENEKLKKCLNNKDIPETLSNPENDLGTIESKEEMKKSEEYSVVLPTADAMNKLEQRFTKLMKEVAELSDEKQKLEHIVLQLQGETETICEYIALYQKQRGILKQREIERNAQLNILSKERENIKSQLESLRGLIKELVPSSNKTMTNGHNDGINIDHSQAENKIMTLLSEIKGSHLIEPDENCIGLENFHPCPCCSGKLINV